MKHLLCLLLVSRAVGAQPTSGCTLTIPLIAGPLTVQNLGQVEHAFQPISLRRVGSTHVPLSMTSSMTFAIQNPGATSGWSLVLSESHSGHSLELDYLPGSGTVVRAQGTPKPGDLIRDQATSGTSLREGRKVLSAPAGTNFGVFHYTLGSSNWELLSLPVGTLPGTYQWKITATIQSSP